MPIAIATVVAVIGQAQVRSAQGELRDIQPGDLIMEGDTIITADGQVELNFSDSRVLEIEPNQVISFTAEMLESTRPDPREAELDSATIEQVLGTIAQGTDIDDQIEEPGAGLAGGGSSDGSSFVRLLDISEGTSPLEGDSLNLTRIVESTTPLVPTSDTELPEEAAPLVGSAGSSGQPVVIDTTAPTISVNAPDNSNDSTPTLTGTTDAAVGSSISLTVTDSLGVVQNFTTTVLADGSFSVDVPIALAQGAYNVTALVTDSAGNTGSANDSGSVTLVNDLPSTSDVSASGNEDAAGISVTLSGADSDGTVTGYKITSLAANGTLYSDAALTTAVVVDATVTGPVYFVPTANWNGNTSFGYTAVDNDGGVDASPAIASITVSAADDPTTVTGGTSGSGNEDGGAITGSLVASDADGLTDGTVFTVSGAASNGAASINAATGAWSYTPVADYNGTDSFTVTITDDAGNTSTQAISLTVNAVADIVADSLTTNEDTAITANVITGTNGASADNFEGTPVLTGVTNGSNGTVAFTAAGAVTYTPNANYNGSDSFTYTVTSPAGVTETTTVSVTVNAVNDPTVVTGGTSGAGNEDAATITGTLTATDLDGLADGTVFTVSGAATHGAASINAATGAWSYTPVADYNGTDSFTVTITDDAGNTSTQAISLTVAAVVDIANDTLSTAEDTPVVILATSLLANDSFENGAAAVTAVGTASNGSVSLAGGNVTYTPNANYNGADSFTYTVTSPAGVTETATVNVTVTPVNDPTTIVSGTSGAGNEDAATITGTLTATDLDGLADGTVFTVSGAASNGTASIDPATGAWSYTPVADYNGLDSFTVTITDDAGNTSTQAISLTVNAVADIVADSLTTNEDNAVTANVITGTFGATADTFEGSPTLTGVTNGTHGTVTFTAAGAVTYTPNANYNGADSFTYTVTSPAGVTETATVNVTVVNVQEGPTATASTSSGNEDTDIAVGLSGTDPDGTVVSVTVTTLP
ncbi:MAG: retention module-containing protein, partial [Pseudomonadota bacterium]|nr:retention module-containing protein [Pseudomonadota bacterium]